MLSVATPTMAQDTKSQIEAITKIIVDNKGDLVATKDAVKNFTKTYKKDAVALAGLGRAFLDVKNFDKANEYADLAIKVGKDKADGYLLKGDIYAVQDNGGEAASWYQQATIFDKQNPTGYIKFARVYQKVDPDGAVAMLEQLRQVKPDYPVDAAAGYMYSASDKLLTAVKYYDKVADVTTLDDYILYDYASTEYALNDFNKSVNLSLSGIQKYPEYSAFLRVAFYSYNKLKDYNNAVVYAEKFFNKKDTLKFSTNDYIYYGEVLSNLGRTDEAVISYGKIKEIDPENKTVNKLVSDAYLQGKQFDKAVASYKLYLQDLGDDAQFNHYRTLADIYVDQMEGADAAGKLAALKNADDVYAQVETKFDYAKEYAAYQRALIHYQMNPDLKKGEAKPYYEKYISLIEPKEKKTESELKKLGVAYQYLAVHYIQNDNVASAKEYAQKLLQVKPDDETAKQIVELK